MVIVAAVGVYFLGAGRALSAYFAGEAESGTLAGGATSQNDTNASGGRYIQFGAAIPPPNPNPGGNPLAGMNFWINPNNNAVVNEQLLRQQGDITHADLVHKIASQPIATWVGHWQPFFTSSDASGQDVTQTAIANMVNAASSKNQVPVFILYYIPHRDCGGASAGGAADGQAYKNWIDEVAAGVGSGRAVFDLEPDALPMIDQPNCLTTAQQQERYSLISYAVQKLKSNPRNVVYIDAGQYDWKPASDMAPRLQQAGVAGADGFSVEVSNYGWATSRDIGYSENSGDWTNCVPSPAYSVCHNSQQYGDFLSSLIGGSKHYIVDTSRSGLGPDPTDTGHWCNPRGRGLGHPVSASTGDALNDAFLWMKVPGESDGNTASYYNCGTDIPAGGWWPDIAYELAQNTPYSF